MIPVIVVIILFLDQLTKFFVTRALPLNQSLPVIKDLFYLTLVHNKGAAFGLLKDQLPFFIAASVLAIIMILRELKNRVHSSIYRFSLSLILSGAIGNLIDRILRGYVVDFLDFRIWPVFNLADSAITVGALLLSWAILFSKERLEKVK
jgi:signal peptidase II